MQDLGQGQSKGPELNHTSAENGLGEFKLVSFMTGRKGEGVDSIASLNCCATKNRCGVFLIFFASLALVNSRALRIL